MTWSYDGSNHGGAQGEGDSAEGEAADLWAEALRS